MFITNPIPMHHITMIFWMCCVFSSVFKLTQILYFAFWDIVITEHRLQLQMRQFILCGDFHAVSQMPCYHSTGVNPLSTLSWNCSLVDVWDSAIWFDDICFDPVILIRQVLWSWKPLEAIISCLHFCVKDIK